MLITMNSSHNGDYAYPLLGESLITPRDFPNPGRLGNRRVGYRYNGLLNPFLR
jgi:hypothetical protein